jgi:hypothetical protein
MNTHFCGESAWLDAQGIGRHLRESELQRRLHLQAAGCRHPRHACSFKNAGQNLPIGSRPACPLQVKRVEGGESPSDRRDAVAVGERAATVCDGDPGAR